MRTHSHACTRIRRQYSAAIKGSAQSKRASQYPQYWRWRRAIASLGRLSALYVNTRQMRCDHRASDTSRVLIYFHDELTDVTADWQTRERESRNSQEYDSCPQICLPPLLLCSLFLSALIFADWGRLGIPFEQVSLCIICVRQLDSDLKKNRESKKGRKEGENVRGAFHDSTLRNTPRAPPMAAHQWADLPATPNLPYHDNPPPRTPFLFLLVHPPLPSLWNKCQTAHKQSSACACSKWPP